MTNSTPYRVGLLGLGTVGLEVATQLTHFHDELERRSGRSIQLARVVARDITRHRRELEQRQIACEVTAEVDAVLSATDVDVVVEVVGGIQAPREWLQVALRHGKDVVTANKAVLAEYGEEIFEVADRENRQILFEGAVAGAIPILQVLRNGLSAGPIERLTGILNGSTNWLLEAMAGGASRRSALERAQELGLLEQDPTLDLSGDDARHKLALLTRLLTGATVNSQNIPTHGITDLDERDLRFGRERGLALKLLGTLDRHRTTDGRKSVRLGVFPTWIPERHPLALVPGEDNALLLEGPTFDRMLFQGKGAGGKPTAGSVVADLVRAARGAGFLAPADENLELVHPLDDPHSFYVRLSVRDQPGMLARIAEAFAQQGVSLATVDQNPISPASDESAETRPPAADLFLVTHATPRNALNEAVEILARDPGVLEPPIWIPCLKRNDS